MRDIFRFREGTIEQIIKFADCMELERLLGSPEDNIVIMDKEIGRLYPGLATVYNPVFIEASEDIKVPATIEYLIGELIKRDATKDKRLTGIGGGVITDLAGFTASIFKRGIGFGFVPTTLMAMADASVGGKNGINYMGIKNVAGLVNQPGFIYIDTRFLDTLPDIEYFSAFSEIIKTGLVDNPQLISLVESNLQEIRNKNPEVLNEIISLSIKSKMSIVQKDQYDTGIRKVLNFGHTFAHAVEIDYGISHGLAVAAGILADIRLSEIILGADSNIFNRIYKIFRELGLVMPFSNKKELNEKVLLHDKKYMNRQSNIVLLKSIGNPVIHGIPVENLASLYKSIDIL